MVAVDGCPSVRPYFESEVAAAMGQLGIEAEEQIRGYLVELLSGFAVSARIQDACTPLAELLVRAQQASGPERIGRMRQLGDGALFLCGFFPDSFDRRGITTDYAQAMGGRAYGLVREAENARGRRQRVRLFGELSVRFLELAQVLGEVRERTAMCTQGEIVRLYQRWCATGSPSLARRLVRRGVHPRRGSGVVH